VEVVLEVVDEDLPVVLENQEDDCQEKKTDEKDDQIDHENHVHNCLPISTFWWHLTGIGTSPSPDPQPKSQQPRQIKNGRI
jgi:hypothetical protein